MMERKTYNSSSMNIHRVERIEITQSRQEGQAPSDVTKIIVYDEDGHRTEVTMFSDEKVEIKQGEPGE